MPLHQVSNALYDLYNVSPSWFGTMRTLSFKGISDIMKASKMGFKPLGKMEGKMNQLPADFLINKNLFISEVYYSKSVDDTMPLEKIFKK